MAPYPAFLAQYFRAGAARLRAGLGNYSKVGRINAVLLGSRLLTPDVVPLLEAGLTDETSGVRYGAARSLLVVLRNEQFGLRNPDREGIARKLAQAAANEANGYVAGKLIEALRDADVPARRDLLITVFNDRVPLHAADPALTYQPELGAMQQLFIAGLGDGGFQREQARQFVRAAARYLRLTTRQLADSLLDADQATAAQNLARQAQTILETLAGNANQPGQRPADLARLLADQPGRAAEVAEAWVAYLAPTPLDLDDDALSIAPPADQPQN